MSANHEAKQAAIRGVEKICGHFVMPLRIDAIYEGIFVAHFFAHTWEDRLVVIEKMLNEIDGGVVVHINAEDDQPFRRIIVCDLIDDGKFIAARLAPGGPESYEKRLAFVVGEKLVVAGEIDLRELSRRGGFCRLG